MRTLLPVASLLLLPKSASALCRCTCIQGEMKLICQPTDVMVPICQGLCETQIRPERVIVPLAGGQQVFESAQSTNPPPGGVVVQGTDLNSNPNGTQLGLPSQFSGSVGSSLSAGSR